jgi:hypothetical protein
METKSVSIDTLKEFEGNPRKGNVKALAESLSANGQYKPIVVRKDTKQILAGNHLWKAAQSLGWTEINIVEIDVDDEGAKKIVAADNRLADLGTYDEQALLDLLEDISLEGTGYQPADIDDLLAILDEQQAPEFGVAAAPAHENVLATTTLEERAQRYAERTIRLLMCEFPQHQYIWAMEKLTELRERFGTESNAETILRMIAELSNSEVPTQ